MNTTLDHTIDQYNHSAQLHDRDRFLDLLPSAIYCSNDPRTGSKLKPKNIAITHTHIRLNCRNLTRFISFDIDHGNALAWYDCGLPPPQYIVKNQHNNKCHYLYVLTNPVSTSDNSRRHPIEYMRSICLAYTRILQADRHYNAALTKNPYHSNYRLVRPTLKPSYTLQELAKPVYDDILDNFNEKIQKKLEQNAPNSEKYESRNCDTFDHIRTKAYKITHLHGYAELYRIVLDMCIQHNEQHTTPMAYNEVKGIARSIAAYCDRNRRKFAATFQAKQKARGRKSARSRSAKSDDRRQLAISLYDRDRLTPTQIAEQMGVSVKTVRHYLSNPS